LQARQRDDWQAARWFKQQAQSFLLDPNDLIFAGSPNRYADDFAQVIGLAKPKLLRTVGNFLKNGQALELSQEKTLITPPAVKRPCFWVTKSIPFTPTPSDHRGQRCINGALG
jgi:hypothetical protein